MKRQRKTYLKPLHPWEKDRMDAEDKILRKYGLLRKKEIWKTQTLLRNFRRQARRLLVASGPQAELETRQLLARFRRLGLVSEGATLDDVLGLNMEKLLERRLQTLVYLKGIARTPKQARQLVLHGHVTIGGRKVGVPSYLVPLAEEGSIAIAEGSSIQAQTKSPPLPPESGAGGEKAEAVRKEIEEKSEELSEEEVK